MGEALVCPWDTAELSQTGVYTNLEIPKSEKLGRKKGVTRWFFNLLHIQITSLQEEHRIMPATYN